MSRLNSSRFSLFFHCLNKVPDPRSKHGTYHPFRTILALVFLGLLGNVTTLAEIERWTKLYFPQLRKFLKFRTKKKKWQIPHAITFARILRGLSLEDLQVRQRNSPRHHSRRCRRWQMCQTNERRRGQSDSHAQCLCPNLETAPCQLVSRWRQDERARLLEKAP